MVRASGGYDLGVKMAGQLFCLFPAHLGILAGTYSRLADGVWRSRQRERMDADHLRVSGLFGVFCFGYDLWRARLYHPRLYLAIALDQCAVDRRCARDGVGPAIF